MITSFDLPYLIVEIANVHGGDKNVVDEIISQLAAVDYPRKGIKFQAFSPQGISLPDFKWFPVYEELFFDEATWRDLIDQASFYSDVWIDVFDIYGVKIVSENLGKIHGIKLQASVLENLEVREALACLDLDGKILMINVSGLELSDIQVVYDDFLDICKALVIQVGYQSYPTKVENTGLQKLSVLKAAFPGVPLCMADHADAEQRFAVNVPVYAALLGCTYIEKHYCLSRETAKYDGFSALEGAQLLEVCTALKEAFSAHGGRFINDAEVEYLKQSIQIPVLKRDLIAGELVALSDLMYRRTSQEGVGTRQVTELQGARKVLSQSKAANSTLNSSDYRVARIAIIVAGRMKSIRLPQKAILPIAGIVSVERCLGQCLGVDGVDRVVLATSNLEADSVLKNHTLSGKVDFWQGHPDDVISRYLGACDHYGIDVVVRVTADCPLVLPEIIECLLQKHFESGADYTAAEDCAVGSAGEVINVTALRKVIDYFGVADYSEYMTWYFRNNPEYFKVNIVSLPAELVRNYRMTLDYPEDLKMFEALYSAVGAEKSFYSAQEVFGVLDSSPDIVSINKHLTLKYKADEELIALLNTKTKISIKF